MTYLASSSDDTPMIRLYVQPKASKTRFTGLHDGCLKMGVAAPPVDGKANKEIQKFLAKMFSISKADIVIKTGAHSRRKLVIIKNRSIAEVRATVEGVLEKLS